MKSESMVPSIPIDAKCISVPLIYGIKIPFTEYSTPGFSRPRRGDIVICIPPTHEKSPWYVSLMDSVLQFYTLGRVQIGPGKDQIWDNDFVIKRIIGVPGDMIKLEGFQAYIKPKGKQSFFSEFEIIQKTYKTSIEKLPEGWMSDFPVSGSTDEFVLGKDEYFLMGDNRTSSKDSMVWGPVNRNLIQSRVILSYLPGFKIH